MMSVGQVCPHRLVVQAISQEAAGIRLPGTPKVSGSWIMTKLVMYSSRVDARAVNGDGL